MFRWRRDSPMGRIVEMIFSVVGGSRQPDPASILSDQLRLLFPEVLAAPASIRRVLDHVDGHPITLARSLFQAELVRLAAGKPNETLEFLMRAVERDFAHDRLVVVEGCTLSRTEASLLALILLTET